MIVILLEYRGTDSDGSEKKKVGMFGHMKRRDETEENIGAVAEMKMEDEDPGWKWKDTVRSDMDAWEIREELATGGEGGNASA